VSEKSERYEVRVEGSDTFNCTNNDDSLLSHLEQQNIDVHYHCREGYCGACRTKLISGDVEYTTDPLAFIDDDEILPCCCKPTSDIQIKLY
jgi:ferredoxin